MEHSRTRTDKMQLFSSILVVLGKNTNLKKNNFTCKLLRQGKVVIGLVSL